MNDQEDRLLHVTVHAHPGTTIPVEPYRWFSRELSRLQLSSECLRCPLPVSFDQVLENLGQIKRCYIEPDGWFVWTSPKGPAVWQIDGQLHDSAIGLMTAELKVTRGSDPEELGRALDRVIQHGLGVSPAQVVLQLVRPGVYVAADQLPILLA